MSVRVILAVLVFVVSAAAEPAKDAKAELDKLQGEWVMVSLEMKGEKSAEEVVKRYKLTIKGDQWVVSVGDSASPGLTFKIDPSKSPKEIDMVVKVGDREVM